MVLAPATTLTPAARPRRTTRQAHTGLSRPTRTLRLPIAQTHKPFDKCAGNQDSASTRGQCFTARLRNASQGTVYTSALEC